MTDISLAGARAIALRAQGFGGEVVPPVELLDRLGAIQLDSVNVLARPQDLVAFARIGPHPVAEMHRDVYLNKRGFEYWGHAASWLPWPSTATSFPAWPSGDPHPTGGTTRHAKSIAPCTR